MPAARAGPPLVLLAQTLLLLTGSPWNRDMASRPDASSSARRRMHSATQTTGRSRSPPASSVSHMCITPARGGLLAYMLAMRE